MAADSVFMAVVVQGHSNAADPRSPNVFNTWTYKRSVNTSPASKAAFIASFISGVATPIYPLLSVEYVMDNIQVRFLDDAWDAWQITTSGMVNGAVTGDAIPSGMGVSVRLGTGFRGKQFRGSKHFGPIAKSSTLADQLSSAAITAWTAAIPALVNSFTDGSGFIWTPQIIQRTLMPYQVKSNPTTINSRSLTTALLNNVIGRMKKRAVRA